MAHQRRALCSLGTAEMFLRRAARGFQITEVGRGEVSSMICQKYVRQGELQIVKLSRLLSHQTVLQR